MIKCYIILIAFIMSISHCQKEKIPSILKISPDIAYAKWMNSGLRRMVIARYDTMRNLTYRKEKMADILW